MSRPVLILGLDGLDLEKTRDWHPELLLDEYCELEVSHFDPISTYDIWPTMYLGQTPEQFAKEQRKMRFTLTSLRNAALEKGKNVAKQHLPDSVKEKIVWRPKDRGGNTSPQKGGKELFEGETLFDPLKARLIDVPGWNFRESLGIQFDEVSLWEAVLEDDGVELCYDVLEEELETKVEETAEALNYPYDLVWTHIHCLDSVQHLFGEEVQREWYEKVSDAVRPLIKHQNAAGVIILSDHGLSGGDHRPPGIVATSEPAFNPLPGRPSEVRDWLGGIVSEDAETNEERMEHLAALGYRDVPNV